MTLLAAFQSMDVVFATPPFLSTRATVFMVATRSACRSRHTTSALPRVCPGPA